MKFSRQFLLGIVVAGVQASCAWALDPVAGPVLNLPAPPAATAPAPTAAAPQVPLCDCPCAPCGDTCHGSFFAGAGLYLIQPYFENNPAYNFIAETSKPTGLAPPKDAGDVIARLVDRVNVSQHLDVAPLIWIGYEGADGFGGRVRYWYLDQGTSQSASLPPFRGSVVDLNQGVPPINPQVVSGTQLTLTSATPLGLQNFADTLSRLTPEATTMTVTTELEVQVLDLEAFQHYRTGAWDFLFSGGVRLAQLRQSYNAYGLDVPVGGAPQFHGLESNYNFQGAGPVLALEVRRALGNSGLTAYTSARGSVVIGSAQQDVSFGGPTLRNDDPNPQFAFQHRDRGLPIGELEFGVEYRRQVGGLGLFGQLALVGQDWFGAGNSSRSSGATPAQNAPEPVEGGSPLDSDITFFGLAVRFGVDF
jgi:hypothetical protein